MNWRKVIVIICTVFKAVHLAEIVLKTLKVCISTSFASVLYDCEMRYVRVIYDCKYEANIPRKIFGLKRF
jgi:hypothetical protein